MPRPKPAWHAEARRIRAEERVAYSVIAARLGAHRSEVVRVCKDIDVGEKLIHRFSPGHVVTPEEIAARAAARLAKATLKPKAPSAPRAPTSSRSLRPDPAWYAEARRIRLEEKIPCWVIAQRLERSLTRVKEVCAGIDIGIDLRNRFQPGHRPSPEAIAKSVANRTGRPVCSTRVFPRPAPVRPSPRRIAIRRAMAAERLRAPAPITLPRLSFLDG